MSQLSYAEQAPAIAGMVADFSGGIDADTMVNGEASAEIAFGKMVVQSAVQSTSGTGTAATGTPAKAKLPAASTDDFYGVVLFSNEYDKRLELGDTGVKPAKMLAVKHRGRVWVKVEVAVATTDAVYARYTTNGGLVPGDFRNDADTAKALRIYGAKFLTATSGAGLALLEFDMAAHRAGLAAA